jgi:hypothetical protein
VVSSNPGLHASSNQGLHASSKESSTPVASIQAAQTTSPLILRAYRQEKQGEFFPLQPLPRDPSPGPGFGVFNKHGAFATNRKGRGGPTRGFAASGARK